MADIDDFTREVECIYKDERYAVRDNGAVFRYPRDGRRPRKYDNFWTFGKPNIVQAIWKSHLFGSMPLSQPHFSAPSQPKSMWLTILTQIVGITEWKIYGGLRGWKIYSTIPLRGRESHCAAAASKRSWQTLLCCGKMNCRPTSDG